MELLKENKEAGIIINFWRNPTSRLNMVSFATNNIHGRSEVLDGMYLVIGTTDKNDSYIVTQVTAASNFSPYLQEKDMHRAYISENNLKEKGFMGDEDLTGWFKFDAVQYGEIKKVEGEWVYFPSTRHIFPFSQMKIFIPSQELMEVILNGKQDTIVIGHIQYGSDPEDSIQTPYKKINPAIFINKRTANFGKTGFGKSNENKVIMSSIYLNDLKMPNHEKTAFLIFDENGEYADSGKLDTAKGLVQINEELGIEGNIVLYTNNAKLKEKVSASTAISAVKTLSFDFYQPGNGLILMELIYSKRVSEMGKAADYIEKVYNTMREPGTFGPDYKKFFYAAMKEAGFQPFSSIKVKHGGEMFDISDTLEYQRLRELLLENVESKKGSSTGFSDLFRYNSSLSTFRGLHGPSSESIFEGISSELKDGKTVIVDIASLNIPEKTRRYIEDRIAKTVFEDALTHAKSDGMRKIIALVEEAHNLLQDDGGVFYRWAKEGRKYGLGMIYSTQSPGSIPDDILSQTENYFIKHLGGENDISALRKINSKFACVENYLVEQVVGLSYILTGNSPYILPIKVLEVDEFLKRNTTPVPSFTAPSPVVAVGAEEVKLVTRSFKR